MKTIHVVMGSTGEYSDRSEWPVLAFSSLEVAQTRVTLATQRAKEIEAQRESKYSLISEDDNLKNEYDPDMRMDYTGTIYFITTVELCEDTEPEILLSPRRKAIAATNKKHVSSK